MQGNDGKVIIEVAAEVESAIKNLQRIDSELSKTAISYNESSKMVTGFSETLKSLGATNESLISGFKAASQSIYNDEIALMDTRVMALSQTQSDEVAIVGQTTNAKFAIISDAHIKELSMIDRQAASKVAGLNDEIALKMESIVLSDQSLAAEITALDAKADKIKEEARLRKEALEKAAETAIIAGLEERIANAATYDEKLKAEAALAEYKKTMAEKQAEADDKKALEKIERDKENARLSALAQIEGAKEAIAATQGEQANIITTAVENYMSNTTDTAQTKLEDGLANAPAVAALLMEAGKLTLDNVKLILESYAPGWQEASKKFITLFNTGITEGSESLNNTTKQIGVNAVQGVIDGMYSKEEDVATQAKRIAEIIRSTLANALEIESPSKVTTRLGKFVGEGLINGTVDTINQMLPRITEAASSIPGAMAQAGGHINAGVSVSPAASQALVTNNYNSELPIIMENVDMRGEQNIRAVSEALAFITRQSLMGKGGQ